MSVGREWKKMGAERQYRIQFDEHNLVMNVRYSKDTAYSPYLHILPWAPPRSDYNNSTGQWIKPPKEKILPPADITNLQNEELRTVQIDLNDETDKKDIEEYV